MRRKLNEGEEFNEELLDGVKICVSDIRNDDSEMDCNELRDIFVEAGAEVFGSHGLKNGKPVTIMTVKGLPEEEVLEILQEFLDDSDTCDDAEAYEINDDTNDSLHDPDNDDYEFPSYEDADALHDLDDDYEIPSYEDVETDDLDPEEDALNDDFLNEDDDILEDAQEELRGLLSNLGENDNITFEPKLGLDEANIISIDSNGDMETEDGDIINAFDLADADDIFTLCDEVKMELDNEAAYPDYDDIDDEEDEELPRFEKIHKGRHLDEKKKNNCCPGTKNINESVIDSVLADLNKKALNESKKVEAKNQKELEKKTLKALTENKHSLHTNVRYNGKSFAKMTLKELKSIFETVKASVDALSERLLNESVVDNKTTETIDRKKQLLEFLDEEITYRTTRMECLRKLNEDSAEISDEELANLFGPAQGEDEASTDNGDNTEAENSNEDGEENKEGDKDENNEENEEVELSRIEITLKDAEAANDLKQACLDADIPEDAFELENVEDDTFEEDGEESEENSKEASEDSSEENSEEEKSEEGANESYEFAKYVKMLGEGEVADEQPADDATGEESSEEENGAENADDESDEETTEEDKQPKFILTNTDYASKLAKVLEDVYGISKEEFEDMIGGEIVEEEPKEDEENSDEEGSENSEESKDEESKDSSEEKKDDEEELDPSDLFKNL